MQKWRSFTMVALLVAALGLAGCGGGGGGGTAAEEPAPTPTPQEMCEADGGRYNADGTCTSAADLAAEQLAATKKRASDAATAARAAAMAAAGLDHADDDATAAAIAAANEAAAAAEAASNAAQDASSQDAASALADVAESQQADAEAALANARTASGMAAQRAADAAATAAVTKSAETKEAAIAAEAAATPGSDSGAFDDTDSGEAYTVGISRDRDGTEIEITDPGMTGDDDPKFMHAMDLGGGKNAFSMHSRTMEADKDGNVEEEVVIIGTDIEAPKATAFAEFEVVAADGTKTTPQVLNARDLDTAVDADGDGTNSNDYTALTVTAGTGDANLKLIKSASFPASSGASAVHTFNFDDTSTADEDEAAEVSGTYNGAQGTYRCNDSSSCTVTTNNKGAVTGISGVWVFTPDEGATSDQPDYDYKHFGVWLKKTTDSDGAVTYEEVQTFAGSSVNASGSLASVVGTAEYIGDAVGVYVHDVTKPEGTRASATSGHFTAGVSLEVNFGGGDVAVNKQFTLTGTIDNFALSGGEENNWKVNLQSDGDPNTEGIQRDDDGVMAGTAKGGSPDDDGSFSATFHGTASATDKPHTVVGEFNASFTNGSVAGAFGARN